MPFPDWSSAAYILKKQPPFMVCEGDVFTLCESNMWRLQRKATDIELTWVSILVAAHVRQILQLIIVIIFISLTTTLFTWRWERKTWWHTGFQWRSRKHKKRYFSAPLFTISLQQVRPWKTYEESCFWRRPVSMIGQCNSHRVHKSGTGLK